MSGYEWRRNTPIVLLPCQRVERASFCEHSLFAAAHIRSLARSGSCRVARTSPPGAPGPCENLRFTRLTISVITVGEGSFVLVVPNPRCCRRTGQELSLHEAGPPRRQARRCRGCGPCRAARPLKSSLLSAPAGAHRPASVRQRELSISVALAILHPDPRKLDIIERFGEPPNAAVDSV